MKNPFAFGYVVTDADFCNREREQSELRTAMYNGERLFLYGERRLGKTSLIKNITKQLDKKKFIAIYIDLYPTSGEASFIEATANALLQELATTNKFMERLKELLGAIQPSVSFSTDGTPTITINYQKRKNLELELETVLNALGKLGKKAKKEVVVIFDEIQQILTYKTDIVEQKLRSITQHQKNICYIFMGSSKHLIREMFLNKSKPLYRSAKHYPIEAISETHWIPFIHKKFKVTERMIPKNSIEKVLHCTEGHPYYTQHLCHVIWEISSAKQPITDNLIQQAIDLLLSRESSAYSALWDSLTLSQKRFITAIAHKPVEHPYSASFIEQHRLTSSAAVKRIVDALEGRDLIEKKPDAIVVSDRFFKLWIVRISTNQATS